MSNDHATSNADEIDRLMAELIGTFDLTRPGSLTDSLGRDLVATAALGIAGRTIGDQQTPDLDPLEENQGEYKRRKEKAGKPIGIGLAPDSRDRMLALTNLTGEVSVEPDEASMTYGQTEIAKRKAQWFTAGSNGGLGIEPSGAVNQPERPFYGLDEILEGELHALCDEHVERFLDDLGKTLGGP